MIPPVIKDDLIAMGRLNDVLIYGGQSTFTVDCEDEEVEKVIDKITSDKCSIMEVALRLYIRKMDVISIGFLWKCIHLLRQ